VWTRTWHLLRARLAMARRGGWPIPALLFLAALAAGLALLVRAALPPFPYALMALSLGALLLSLPLLSDLGALLRHDEGGEWVAALPALPSERTLARLAHLLLVLAALVLAWCTPWALLAPAELALPARLALPLAGLGLVLFVATILVWAQQLFLARLEGAFVALETAVMVLVVVGLAQLLGHLPELARLTPSSPGMLLFPPAWYARPLLGSGAPVALALALLSLAALARVPPGAPRARRRRDLVQRWLAPLHALALRFWVRPDERGPFELVYSALPREREVALRTYPMLGIPLAFLCIGATGAHADGEPWRRDLLALLLFTVGVYLPLLLTHVPLSETPQASWILRTAPVSEGARTGGAIKALFVRWLVPLYLGLLALGLALSELEILARLWLPALLLALLLLRRLYPACVRDLPLSVAPEDLRSEVDWAGQVTALAVGSTLVAVLANRYLGVGEGILAAGLLLAAEIGLERKLRRDLG
jgi:hypothetical protein